MVCEMAVKAGVDNHSPSIGYNKDNTVCEWLSTSKSTVTYPLMGCGKHDRVHEMAGK